MCLSNFLTNYKPGTISEMVDFIWLH